MTAPEIQVIQQKLDDTLAQLKDMHDPERKRELLKQMRSLMATLDKLVFDSTRIAKQSPSGPRPEDLEQWAAGRQRLWCIGRLRIVFLWAYRGKRFISRLPRQSIYELSRWHGTRE